MTAQDILHELSLGPVTTESLVSRLEGRGIPATDAVRLLNGLVFAGSVTSSRAIDKVWYRLKGEAPWEPEGTKPLLAGRLSKRPEAKLDWKAATKAIEDHAAGRVGTHLAYEALERAGFAVLEMPPERPALNLSPYGEKKAKPAFDLEEYICFVLSNSDLLAPTAVTIMHRVTAMKGLRPFELSYKDVLGALNRLREAKKVGTLAPDDNQGTGWFLMRRK